MTEIDISKADSVHESKESYDLTSQKAEIAKIDSDLPVNKNMLISETIEQYPQLLDIFMENGLHCVGCAFSPFDTIDTGCKTHGWEEEKIDHFVATLNEAITGEDLCCGGGCCSTEPKETDSCGCC